MANTTSCICALISPTTASKQYLGFKDVVDIDTNLANNSVGYAFINFVDVSLSHFLHNYVDTILTNMIAARYH